MKTENEIIAEFMGLQVYETHEQMRAVPIEDLKEWAYTDQLDYDKSWNSLMPVIEKIAEMKAEVKFSTTPNRCLISYFEDEKDEHQLGRIYTHKDHRNVEGETLLNVTYSAVVRFIKWYNSQPK